MNVPATRHHPRKIGSLLLILVCCLLSTHCGRKAKKAQGMPEPVVQVAKAVRKPVQIVRSWTGTLAGSTNVDVRTRVSGYITEQNYSDGQTVKKGAPLFVIDRRPFEVSLRQAEANHLESIARQTRARQDAERYGPLAAKDAVSKQDYEHAVQASQAADAAVAATAALIEQAKLNLLFTNITSEIDGVAGFAKRQVGDLVSPSDPQPLTTVSTVDPIKVSFQVSEQEYLEAKRNAEATGKPPKDVPDLKTGLTLADRSRYPHDGKFVSISREVNEQTGTFEVTAYFPNPGNILRPGQFGRVDAVVANEPAIVVPQRAVVETQGTFQVIVIDPDGKAQLRPVEPGRRIGSEWVIRSGLQEGETVIVEGVLKVRGGMTVKVTPWTPPVETKPETETKPEAKPEPQGK